MNLPKLEIEISIKLPGEDEEFVHDSYHESIEDAILRLQYLQKREHELIAQYEEEKKEIINDTRWKDSGC